MSHLRKPIFMISLSTLVLLLVTGPFIFAILGEDNGFVFNGFLLNPLDGNSYLAKMYQGWEGNWKFVLPFTSDPGKGAYLFLFYLALGHLARILNLQLLTIFHVTRILGCISLLWALWQFYGSVFLDSRLHKLAFAVSSLGSGLGWILISTGHLTSDFWVAEAYPFLSSYTNPHFPFGLSLLLFLIRPPLNQDLKWMKGFLIGFCAFVISMINPFGIVITLMVLGGVGLWAIIKRLHYKNILIRVFIVGIAGLPLLIYDLWVTNTDPVFAVWNTQNLTPSPPVWDLVFSLSPVLILGVIGYFKLKKMGGIDPETPMASLVVWSCLGLLLLYIPINLQRRFMMGMYVPLVGLAVVGLKFLARNSNQRFNFLTVVLIVLVFPTNLIIIFAAQGGIMSHDPQIYLDKEEVSTLYWVVENTEPDALILSSPEMGLFIPAYTGRRVLYGHPFETVEATEEKAAVISFFDNSYDSQQRDDYLEFHGVDYIFFGPRERSIGILVMNNDWDIVYHQDEVTLYRVGQ